MDLENKIIFISGGTGSFGQAFTKDLLLNYNPKKIIIFSRSEFNQAEMEKNFKHLHDDKLRFIIGDIRDKESVTRAMKDVDLVIHTAALKRVDTAEYNPLEFIKTNIIGSQNIIESAIENKVKKVVALSTDKASSPCTLYGGTKFVADKLFQSANVYSSGHKIELCVVRYGNVAGSKGSIIPLFKSIENHTDTFPLTDPNMTRFWISMKEAMELVYIAIEKGKGGEIFVSKIPSFYITDLIRAFGKKSKIIGNRENEKLHEEMISITDYVWEYDKYYTIYPKYKWFNMQNVNQEGIQKEFGFSFTSDRNNFLTVDEIRERLVNL